MKMESIKNHYDREAKDYGDSKQATMRDTDQRDKEIEKIIEYLRILKARFKNLKILEVGSGNGYAAEQITRKLDFTSLNCIDICEKFIEIARKRNLENVKFDVQDVLHMEFNNASFDIVFSERCLINLGSWSKQQEALSEILRVLKVGGIYLMIESFKDGLDNLNEARKVIGLDIIPPAYHNVLFDKKKFLHFINDKFKVEKHEAFLSSYYFGSRVIYPALIEGKKEIVYNNKFVEFFKYLPAYGNYSAAQMFVLRKM